VLVLWWGAWWGFVGGGGVWRGVGRGMDTWVVLVSGQGYRWRERMTSMSFHSGGALPPQRHARSSTCPPQHRPQLRLTWSGEGTLGNHPRRSFLAAPPPAPSSVRRLLLLRAVSSSSAERRATHPRRSTSVSVRSLSADESCTSASVRVSSTSSKAVATMPRLPSPSTPARRRSSSCASPSSRYFSAGYTLLYGCAGLSVDSPAHCFSSHRKAIPLRQPHGRELPPRECVHSCPQQAPTLFIQTKTCTS